MSTSIKQEFKILKIYVYKEIDGVRNIVTNFDWAIKFTDGVMESVAGGNTWVPEYDPEAPFTPIEDLTESDYRGWILEQMGETQYASLVNFHVSEVQRKTKMLEFDVYFDQTQTSFIPEYNNVIEI